MTILVMNDLLHLRVHHIQYTGLALLYVYIFRYCNAHGYIKFDLWLEMKEVCCKKNLLQGA